MVFGWRVVMGLFVIGERLIGSCALLLFCSVLLVRELGSTGSID